MAVTLLFKPTRTQIDSLVLDATVTERHGVQIDVTQHPVEKGANIADHRRPKLRSLTLEGVVSNYPLPDPGAEPFTQVSQTRRGVLQFQARSEYDPTRVKTAYQQLLDLAESNDLITIVTGLEEYENMTLVSLDVPRDARTGEALNFTATFSQIRIVENAVVAVNKARTTRGQAKADKGVKNGSPTPEQQQKTVLKTFKDYVNGQISQGKNPFSLPPWFSTGPQ